MRGFIGGFVAKIVTWFISVFAIFRAGEASQRNKDINKVATTLEKEAKAGAEAVDVEQSLKDGTF